uniref:CUB domain-containing protein n=1 Tax=Amazona collaria TaxID=241587 RepID=A0A8B9G508_9PSIT
PAACSTWCPLSCRPSSATLSSRARSPGQPCGGTLRSPEGSFSSPNYPSPYPPDSLCIWRIEASPGLAIQLKMETFSVEGTASCLFDRVDGVTPCCVPRFCGNVVPPTFNTNSNHLRVTFVSDSSVGAPGFSAHYRAVAPKCGGPLTALEGHFSTPNHPQPYPHQQLCLWQISVPVGHVIDLHFHNFSLEMHEDCSFDFVEVHDSAGTGAASLMGRYRPWYLRPCYTSLSALGSCGFDAQGRLVRRRHRRTGLGRCCPP